MTEPPDEWLSLPEAAVRLGIAENALRSRIKRRTIRARKDNHGRLLVCLPGTLEENQTLVRSRSDPGSNPTTTVSAEPIDSPPEVRQSGASVPDMIPASIHLATLEALQASHVAALAALQTAHVTEIERFKVAHARELAERDTLHRTTIAELRRLLDRLLPRNDHQPVTLPRPWWAPSWFGPAKRSRLRSP